MVEFGMNTVPDKQPVDVCEHSLFSVSHIIQNPAGDQDKTLVWGTGHEWFLLNPTTVEKKINLSVD